MKKNWETKEIKDVCTVIAGQSPEGKYYNNEGKGLPFYQGKKEFTEKYLGTPRTWTTKVTKEAKNGDILMSVRAPVGPVNFATQQVCIGRGLAAIRASGCVDPEYLFYFFIYNESKIKGTSGAVFSSINKTQIGKIVLPLTPLPEQRRIVAILDKVFQAIDSAKANAEKNLKNAPELFESYSNNLFSQDREHWVAKKLGSIGKVSMCKRIFKNQTTSTGDIPFFKIGTFGKEPNSFISKEIYREYKNKYSFPKKGDILISASGTIGRCVKYDGAPAYFQDSNIVWIDNDEKQVLNDYLYEFYGVCNWSSTKGATISRLYNSNLRSIKISFPKSKNEQQNIVQHLYALKTEIKNLISLYQQKLTALDELKKSILHQAFSGEL